MKRIGILKADYWVNIINWGGILIILGYFFSMFVFPIVKGWEHAQRVWHNWQSLNVGMLAFASSLIALNISRINAKKQREREFIAARAFLPDALSELNSYFENCASLLKEAWSRVNDDINLRNTPLRESLPELPASYKEIFSRCIATSEPDVGEYLAYILMCLQIHHSRLESVESQFCENRGKILTPTNIMAFIYCLGELQALVNKTYDFARGHAQFDDTPLEALDFSSAYSGLGIEVEEYGDLYGFTQRKASRKH